MPRSTSASTHARARACLTGSTDPLDVSSRLYSTHRRRFGQIFLGGGILPLDDDCARRRRDPLRNVPRLRLHPLLLQIVAPGPSSYNDDGPAADGLASGLIRAAAADGVQNGLGSDAVRRLRHCFGCYRPTPVVGDVCAAAKPLSLRPLLAYSTCQPLARNHHARGWIREWNHRTL